jgi:DNA-binding MarR family transcriptional regulator
MPRMTSAIRKPQELEPVYDAKSFEPSKSVGYLVNRVRIEMLAEIDRELEPFDVSSAQYFIMGHLIHGMADSASGLCKGIAYDPGAMTRMVDRLEAKGLIRRVRSEDDRRAVKLEVTGEGKVLFPKMRVKVIGVLNHMLRGFTKSEARQVEGLLQRVLTNFG